MNSRRFIALTPNPRVMGEYSRSARASQQKGSSCPLWVMCGWPPPGKRKCSVPHKSRLQSCVRPVHAVRMD
jgi:hypothetical protein